MANLFDYIKWRGDISMEYDPFNEVDNLLFSQLSYIDFGGIVPLIEEDKEITLKDAYELYYQRHTKEEVLARKSFTKMCVFLMDDMIDSIRYQNVKVGGFIDEYDEETVKQMCAMYFVLPDNSIYVAFRGTDKSVTGWKEDFYFSYIHGTSGQKSALKYLKTCLDRFPNRNIRVGGHSKGGNFALYASIYAGERQDAIYQVWCNDSPGMMKAVYEEAGFLRIKDRIRCILPESSLIGVLMTSPVKEEVVSSSAKGIMQHDGNTWQIQGNHFIHLESLSYEGHLNDMAIQRWLEEISLDERKKFIDIIFSILEESDIRDFRQFNERVSRWLPALNHAIENLDKESQVYIKETIFRLMKTYFDLGFQKLKEKENLTVKDRFTLPKIEIPDDKEIFQFFLDL